VRTIDLNADLGERPGEEPLYEFVTSANVACGGHVGDEASMSAAVRLSLAHGVAIGAHPSYPDRAGFGRTVPRGMDPGAIAGSIEGQIRDLARIAKAHGARLGHVKPHGALYNEAARDPEMAGILGESLSRVVKDLILVGLAGSRGLEIWRQRGFRVAAEGFADRAYRGDGSLIPRSDPRALVTDPARAAAQAVRLAESGSVETICVHSDSPGAEAILAAVRKALLEAGFELRSLSANRDRP
jgi:UPF0271 protein